MVRVPLVGVPSNGVVKVGLVAKTKAPVPVSSEMTPASCADVVAANWLRLPPVYATVPPAPNATEEPSVPVNVSVLLAVSVFPSAIVSVDPVAGAVNATLLIDVADAIPSVGVTSVGLVANTAAPEPVSSVKAAARFALEGVAKNVATPVPRPETPVEIGRPVQLVSVPLVGVPSIGVVRVGLTERTTDPVPVDVVTPVPPLATGRVPVTSDVRVISPRVIVCPAIVR